LFDYYYGLNLQLMKLDHSVCEGLDLSVRGK
jgi:hypothetical protein